MSIIDLIDWGLVGFSALWILGASLLLATFGFGYYVAQERRAPIRFVLRGPGYRLGLNVGLALFALGMAGNAAVWWERSVWAILAVLFAFQAFRAARRRTSLRSAGRRVGTLEDE
jgi:hypothetical protein